MSSNQTTPDRACRIDRGRILEPPDGDRRGPGWFRDRRSRRRAVRPRSLCLCRSACRHERIGSPSRLASPLAAKLATPSGSRAMSGSTRKRGGTSTSCTGPRIWIEEQLERVLVRHEASVGYSTCFWHNVLHSTALFDCSGWYRDLQEKAARPYPRPLQSAIIARNHPILRQSLSSYLAQIERAVRRGDSVASNTGSRRCWPAISTSSSLSMSCRTRARSACFSSRRRAAPRPR